MGVLQGCCKVLHKYGAERVRQGPTGVHGRGHVRPAKHVQIAYFLRAEAEGEGFEPSVDRKAHNGFRGRAGEAAKPLVERSGGVGECQGEWNLKSEQVFARRSLLGCLRLKRVRVAAQSNPASRHGPRQPGESVRFMGDH
jgi:hypothetical protein